MTINVQRKTEHPAHSNARHALQPQSVLESLASQDKPVLFEIEFTRIRFRSRITLQDGQVVVAKPVGLDRVLTAESYVRVRLPGGHGEEYRLKVVVPQAAAADGSAVFICSAPAAPVKSKRASDRYSVAHDARLRLEWRGHAFPLADLSLTGLRIVLPAAQMRQDLPIGHNLGAGNLMFGAEVWVRLGQLIPRNRQERTVGCEFKAVMDAVSQQNLMALVDSLQHTPISVMAGTHSPHHSGAGH